MSYFPDCRGRFHYNWCLDTVGEGRILYAALIEKPQGKFMNKFLRFLFDFEVFYEWLCKYLCEGLINWVNCGVTQSLAGAVQCTEGVKWEKKYWYISMTPSSYIETLCSLLGNKLLQEALHNSTQRMYSVHNHTFIVIQSSANTMRQCSRRSNPPTPQTT